MKFFIYEGIRGSVDAFGFVRWNGAGFHKECAKPGLRAAIDSAA